MSDITEERPRLQAAGAMPRVELSNCDGTATIFKHGAHLTAWTPREAAPVLWVSAHSAWSDDKPIRGGVPLCFPWFGPNVDDAAAPVHGWARISTWELLEQDESSATFGLERDGWELRYTVRLARELELELAIRNVAATARTCSAALHTYFAIGDVRRCTVHGLEGAEYVDKVRGGERALQDGAVEIGGETDRVYFSEAPVQIHDETLRRKVTVSKTGSGATVVWNPWIAKAAAMPDFGDDEWEGMLCVETANALDTALAVGAGRTHVMSARIAIDAL